MNPSQITGYVWYDPSIGFYQKGSKLEFHQFYQSSTQKQECQILYEMTSETSETMIDMLVEELNEAKRDAIITKYWKIV